MDKIIDWISTAIISLCRPLLSGRRSYVSINAIVTIIISRFFYSRIPRGALNTHE